MLHFVGYLIITITTTFITCAYLSRRRHGALVQLLATCTDIGHLYVSHRMTVNVAHVKVIPMV
jgi:hypothetical protein